MDGISSRSTGCGVGLVLLLVIACLPGLTRAQDDTELARKTQNPVADRISVPFQNNLNFGVGPGDDLQYILNVQPVIPFRLTQDWNLISRTIMPLIYQPELAPGFGDVFGLGDIQQSLFLSPARPGSAGAREVATRPRPPRRAAPAAGAGFGGGRTWPAASRRWR